MKELDFTPTAYRAHLVSRRARRRFRLWMILLVGTMSGWGLLNQARISRARASLAELQSAHTQQDPLVEESHRLLVELATVSARHARIADQAGGVRMYQVLAELSARIPASAVLSEACIEQPNRVDTSPNPAPDAVREPARAAPRIGALKPASDGNDSNRLNTALSGYAQRESAVARAVNELGQSLLFRDVELRFSRPVEVGGEMIREFEIACRLPEYQ